MLEELLTPLDITVMTDFSVMTDPPVADILLLRRDQPKWSDEQKSVLPDGIRDTMADHILIEFKYTESVNHAVLSQTLAYDTFYKRIQKLKSNRVQTVIISSKTPAKTFMQQFEYSQTLLPGVYHSKNPMLQALLIIELNGLTDAPHNLFVKCFASKKTEKDRAFKKLFASGKQFFRSGLYSIIAGLWRIINLKEVPMESELTPEKVMEIGKEWEALFLNFIPVERRLAGLKPEERLAGLKPEERLAGLKLEEIEAYLKEIKQKS